MASPANGAIQDPFGLVGTILDSQYRAEAVVGEGGFGVVYRGRHLSLDQPIAIKALKGLDGGDPQVNALVLEKFRDEARLLYTLSQSSLNIVRSLDFGASTTPSGAWAPFMVLEWLDGRSLSDDLDERRRQGMRGRSIAEAMTILEPVALGLSVAHRQHVAHRDIKPANIFLLVGGGPGSPRVKVLDFGIAKIMKDGESAGTKGTLASFTWGYATPEQLDPRHGATGLPTDVYAFALVLTELLTDRAPVDTRDVVEIMQVATNPAVRPTPRVRGANIPDAFEAACQRALAVDPKHRFASIDAFWAALAAARDGAQTSTTMQPPLVSSHRRNATALPMSVPMSYPRPTPIPETRAPSHGRTLVAPMSMPLASPQAPPMSLPFASPQAPPMSVVAAPPSSVQAAPHYPPVAAPPPSLNPGGSNAIVIFTVIAFVLATLLAGSCFVVQHVL